MNAFGIAVTVLAVSLGAWIIWYHRWLGVYIIGMGVGAALIERYSDALHISSFLAVGVFVAVTFLVGHFLFKRGRIRKET